MYRHHVQNNYLSRIVINSLLTGGSLWQRVWSLLLAKFEAAQNALYMMLAGLTLYRVKGGTMRRLCLLEKGRDSMKTNRVAHLWDRLEIF